VETWKGRDEVIMKIIKAGYEILAEISEGGIKGLQNIEK
jgi:hypothetical protein